MCNYNKYVGVVYMQACVETCLDRTIAETCGCYRSEYLLYYPDRVLDKLPACSSNSTRKYFLVNISKYIMLTSAFPIGFISTFPHYTLKSITFICKYSSARLLKIF